MPTQPPVDIPGRFTAGTMVVRQLPEESGYPLREEEFDLLCEGESASQDRSLRNNCIGVAATAVAGFVGLIATVDWEMAISNKKILPWFWLVLLSVAAASSGIIAFVAHRRQKRVEKKSGFARVKQRIENYFENVGQRERG